MFKQKVNWHTKQVVSFKKEIVLAQYANYLKSEGLRNETIKLYLGRINAFLDYNNTDLLDIKAANDYRDLLIECHLSQSHINNTCFAIKKFFEMNGIYWTFKILKPNEGVPFYFDAKDIQAIFAVCSNIKHLAMLQTLFYGCLRSSELCRLDDKDLDLRITGLSGSEEPRMVPMLSLFKMMNASGPLECI